MRRSSSLPRNVSTDPIAIFCSEGGDDDRRMAAAAVLLMSSTAAAESWRRRNRNLSLREVVVALRATSALPELLEVVEGVDILLVEINGCIPTRDDGYPLLLWQKADGQNPVGSPRKSRPKPNAKAANNKPRVTVNLC